MVPDSSAFLDFITSKDDPIGKVTHYYYRREYQGRGLQHFHFLTWIQNAQIIGMKSDEEENSDEEKSNEKLVMGAKLVMRKRFVSLSPNTVQAIYPTKY